MLNYVKVVLISIMLIVVGCAKTPPPRDNDLIEIFNNNKNVFEDLRRYLYKDGYNVISITPEWSDPSGIPLKKKEMYYDLLKKINAQQIIERDGTVTISIWTTGNVSGGDSKGYVFNPNDSKWPRENKDSLDDVSFTGEDFFYKREISGGWYIFYDHSL